MDPQQKVSQRRGELFSYMKVDTASIREKRKEAREVRREVLAENAFSAVTFVSANDRFKVRRWKMLKEG